MILARGDLMLRLQGPVMTKSSAMGGFGIDAAMAQSQGFFYLPGTLVKGRLREAWQELKAAAPAAFNWPIAEWLGVTAGNRQNPGDFQPRRSRIYFDDLRGPAANQPSGTRYRIRIDSARGSVEKGALLVLEAPFASGADARFTGAVTFLAKDQPELDRMKQAVTAGLRWVTSFGAERSVGFGANIAVGFLNVQIRPITVAQQVNFVNGAGAFQIELGFQQPFAVGTRLLGQNLFEGDDCIPGAAVRGAIGELLARGLGFRELTENLSKVRVTHAFPATDQGARPQKLPQSLVSYQGGISDAALLVDPPANLAAPPAFPIDWKPGDWEKAAQLGGWPDVRRELRVRTAIAGEQRRAADNELFAQRLVVPGERKWIASVDLSRIDNGALRTTVARQLAGVFAAGLPGIGKTKAFASITVTNHQPPAPAVSARPDGKFIVCLQTPALLLQPVTASNRSPDSLKNAYVDAWISLCKGSLTLINFFQSNTLAGGDYLYHTFQAGQQYRPYLLTDAGSVFVFEAVDPKAATGCLERWLRFGLPLPPACREFYVPSGVNDSDLWKHCPYIPENGYGEIAVNLPVHQQHAWGGHPVV